MRDPDPHSDAGRAEPLALDQDVIDHTLRGPGQRGSALGQLLQRLFLVGRAQLSNHAARRDQIGDLHYRSRNSGLALSRAATGIKFRIAPPDIAVRPPINQIEFTV